MLLQYYCIIHLLNLTLNSITESNIYTKSIKLSYIQCSVLNIISHNCSEVPQILHPRNSHRCRVRSREENLQAPITILGSHLTNPSVHALIRMTPRDRHVR